MPSRNRKFNKKPKSILKTLTSVLCVIVFVLFFIYIFSLLQPRLILNTRGLEVKNAGSGEKKNVKNCSMVFEKTVFVYNGKGKRAAVDIFDGDVLLQMGKDYKKTYRDYIDVGTATVTIEGIGDYEGELTEHYQIIPIGTTITGIVANEDRVDVSWNMQPTETTGYQIEYSLNIDFSNAVSQEIESISETKRTISGLIADRTYYVRIRTYKKIGDNYYYSIWSQRKEVKT